MVVGGECTLTAPSMSTSITATIAKNAPRRKPLLLREVDRRSPGGSSVGAAVGAVLVGVGAGVDDSSGEGSIVGCAVGLADDGMMNMVGAGQGGDGEGTDVGAGNGPAVLDAGSDDA